MADAHGSIHGRTRHKATLLSFSGIDGAGKTTQIVALRRVLAETGNVVLLLSFWDDVAFATNMRTELSHRLFGGDRGIGHPDRPVSRRDKDVKSWYTTVARLALYSLDTICTHLAVRQARRSGADVVIFDRYIYDELANLFPGGWLTRTYARVLQWCNPRLDMAFLLDADPQGARARKPEYPLEFLKRNRESYLAIAKAAGMTVIPPLPESQVSLIVMQAFRKQQSSSPQAESPVNQPASKCEESAPLGADQ